MAWSCLSDTSWLAARLLQWGGRGAAREASGASSSLQASLGVEEVVNYLRLAGCQVSELRYRGSYRDLARNGCLKICYRARAPSLVPTSTSTDGPLMPLVQSTGELAGRTPLVGTGRPSDALRSGHDGRCCTSQPSTAGLVMANTVGLTVGTTR